MSDEHGSDPEKTAVDLEPLFPRPTDEELWQQWFYAVVRQFSGPYVAQYGVLEVSYSPDEMRAFLGELLDELHTWRAFGQAHGGLTALLGKEPGSLV
jgi:hypothetical protein